MLTILLGGARSGKSSLAERLARRAADELDEPAVFIATCPRIPGDDDLDERIRRHRAERPADWLTIEEELDLAGALRTVGRRPVVIDCLTTWVGNLLQNHHTEVEVLSGSEAAVAEVRSRATPTIVVSNEVGAGIVPADAETRAYRDALGRVNQQWVSAADRALLLVAGRAIDLRPLDELL
jgi:adenosylcobinamide kinase/adenosylcobinamide-phosphate guanylyltransferase